MRYFRVFYDVIKNYGVLEEQCIRVHCRNKTEAINIYKNLNIKNSIFRSVKTL